MRYIFAIVSVILALVSCTMWERPDDKVEYVVVFKIEENETTLAPWQEEVFSALEEKYPAYKVTPLTWQYKVEETHEDLARLMPKYTCFVTAPGEGGHDFVEAISRMTRRLNCDPYIDTFWGILTGYTHDDIIQLAKFNQPIAVARGLDATGAVNLSVFDEAVCFDENKRNQITKYVNTSVGKQEKQEIPTNYDSTDSFMHYFKNTQLIMTSAHATERDWNMGYPDARSNMILNDKNGEIVAINLNKKHYKLTSDEPKIWLAAGNCLIGNIPDTVNCMVNAAIHSCAVKQFVGYTVVTWFGEQGWGTLGKFTTPPGFYTLNQAFHFSNQDILKHLLRADTRYVDMPFGDHSHKNLSKSLTQLVKNNNGIDQKTVGRIFDRDVVAFYGDPALAMRVKNEKPIYKVTQHLSPKFALLEISKSKDAPWPDAGLYIAFETTLNAPVLASALTDSSFWNQRFIYLAKEDLKGEKVEIKFTTIPFHRAFYFSGIKPYELKAFSATPNYEAQIDADFNALLFSLDQATANKIVESIEDIHSAEIQFYTRFLLTRMPKEDLKTLDISRVIENATYAKKARDHAPWKDALTDDIFLRYVLPDWVLDERRDAWRKLFYDTFSEVAFRFKSPSEAIAYLNKAVFDTYGVKYHATKRPKPNQSALESIEAKYASCSGLSIMLIDACRAVGIPARMVGCPVWTDRSGNHNWVEFYDGQWIYEGASLSDPRQRDWVGDMVIKKTNPQKRENTIWATTTEPQNGDYFIQVWAPHDSSYPAIPITENYTDSTQKVITIPFILLQNLARNLNPNEKLKLYIYAKNEPVFSKEISLGEPIKAFLPPQLGPYTYYIVDRDNEILKSWQ